MDQLRRVFATVSKYLAQLNTTQRLLAGCLGAVVFLGLIIVAQLSGKQQWEELLPGMPAADQQKAVSILSTSGIPYDERGGMVVVPGNQQVAARARILQTETPTDTAVMFRNILEKQSWQMSRQQNEQLYTIALQNELAATIANFSGIEKATVIIDAPEPQGIGRAVRRPTASATVFTRGGRPLEQQTVDAIANLISGARSGLSIENVRVTDGSSGRQRNATADGASQSGAYLEHAAKVETQVQAKLLEQLAYIPGRIVTVSAQVDVTKLSAVVTKHLEKGEGTVALLKRSQETTSNTQETQAGAEPGLGSNVTASINRSSAGPGSKTDTTQEDRDMENHVGTRVEQIVDPKGMPTMIAVSVGVPHNYVGELVKRALAPAPGGAAATEPTEADIAKRFDEDVKPKLIAQILPHVRALSSEGKGMDAAERDKLLESQIAVSLIPVEIASINPGTAGGDGSVGASGLTGVIAMGGGLIEKAVLGLLAVVSLGMMLMVVRRSGKRTELPSAEELVGLPPKLQTSNDMMGEAEETDTPMAGIEVGEEEVASQKMLEQVGDLVKQSPDSAAKLLNRWIAVEP